MRFRIFVLYVRIIIMVGEKCVEGARGRASITMAKERKKTRVSSHDRTSVTAITVSEIEPIFDQKR